MNAVQKFKDNVNTEMVTSAVVASIIIGVGVYAARKAGMGTVATVVRGGK